MKLTEEVFNRAIRIDFGNEIHYSSDKVFLDYPINIPTVSFTLLDTDILNCLADDIRKEKGYKPCFSQVDENDPAGFYDFYLGIYDYNGPKVDSYIEFVVLNSDEEDNDVIYQLDLDESDRKIIYKILNRQLMKYLGKDCEELLKESRKEMEDAD